jgi:hypothetical protein
MCLTMEMGINASTVGWIILLLVSTIMTEMAKLNPIINLNTKIGSKTRNLAAYLFIQTNHY